MIKIVVLCITVIVTACATSPDAFELAKIEPGRIYRFSNPSLNTSLYVKFLAPTPAARELLFKTAKNSEKVQFLEIGAPGVYYQRTYQISERGKISFHVVVPGLFEEMLRYHQYANSGMQSDELAVFRYQLDIQKAMQNQ